MGEAIANVTEISRRAGCSIATVSRVLNNSASVSPKKREAVLKAMRETEYLSARASRRGNMLRDAGRPAGGVVEIIQHRHSPVNPLSIDGGVVQVGPLTAIPESGVRPASAPLGTSFFRKIVDGAVEELSRWGYRAQLRFESDLLAPSLVADMNSPARDGMLLIGEYSKDLPQFVSQCLHPLVLVDLIQGGSADMVVSDNFAGVRATFDHLYGLGHRKIGFVGRHDEITAFAERFNMYKLAMAETNLPLRPDWVYDVGVGIEHLEATAAGVRRILEGVDRPTALVCANDWFALGALRAAASLGISVPEQLSVAGFDDEDFASLVTPPLTTVRVPLQEMGRQAVRQLMVSLLGGPIPHHRGCTVRLGPDLIVRQSTAAPVAR